MNKLIPLFLTILFLITSLFPCRTSAQTISKDFSLACPNSEPDGRSDVVKISSTDFVTIAKVKGNLQGKADFVMERYNNNLEVKWQVPLHVEGTEDFKDVYYNGKDVILLSVIHNEQEKKTRLQAYGFDVNSGNKLWTKELEAFDVGDWQTNPHKGKVKETFIDIICEHTSRSFVTPFEYKHNINFSPDQKKFVSYVFNYGEKNLIANVSVYDNSCNLISRGTLTIDNDYTNHGIYVDNKGLIYIVNATNNGKVNFIRYNLATKDFELVEIPAASMQKDDFHVHFFSDDIVYLANVEMIQDKVMGVKYSRCNFKEKKTEAVIFENFSNSDELKAKVAEGRKGNKQIKGEEDWKEYDLAYFIVNPDESALIVLEKRSMYADGYPHIKKDAFDKSHKVELSAHVHAEGIILLSFDREGDIRWVNYIAKNQVYPANDGLNCVSFVLQKFSNKINILYSTAEGMDGMLTTMNFLSIDENSGNVSKQVLPNPNKLTLVRDYSIWLDEKSLVVVGKKGMLGKSSMISRYNL